MLNSYSKMKKRNQKPETKYVSAEKIQKYLMELSEVFSDCKRVRAQKCEDGVKILSNGGYLQISIDNTQKGGGV